MPVLRCNSLESVLLPLPGQPITMIFFMSRMGQAPFLINSRHQDPAGRAEDAPIDAFVANAAPWLAQAAEATGAEVVQVVGRKVTLYRKNPEKTIIDLR